MKQVLVVEDSRFFGNLVAQKLEESKRFAVVWAKDMQETIRLLDDEANNFFAAILDFNLPDAPDGEVVGEVVGRNIPSIVFTGGVSDEVRNVVWSLKVVDYVLKDDMQSLGYIVQLLLRLEKNEATKVLVVDDSSFFRNLLSDLLLVQRFRVLQAADGKEALEVLARNPDIKLVITDFNMPQIGGLELTQKIRANFSRDHLAIIGVSAQGEHIMAARFIKNGANDFIIKQSFLPEEFYCRINQCIENLDNIRKIREASIRDFLTGLYNRRFFFDTGNKIFAASQRNGRVLACGMLDLDYFKKVNDTYGHDIGDLALRHVADILEDRMRDADIVARMGGEEFCILAVNMDHKAAAEVFEELRQAVEKSKIPIGNGQEISVTISIGLVTELGENLEAMVNEADALLYNAKQAGRNRVMCSG